MPKLPKTLADDIIEYGEKQGVKITDDVAEGLAKRFGRGSGKAVAVGGAATGAGGILGWLANALQGGDQQGNMPPQGDQAPGTPGSRGSGLSAVGAPSYSIRQQAASDMTPTLGEISNKLDTAISALFKIDASIVQGDREQAQRDNQMIRTTREASLEAAPGLAGSTQQGQNAGNAGMMAALAGILGAGALASGVTPGGNDATPEDTPAADEPDLVERTYDNITEGNYGKAAKDVYDTTVDNLRNLIPPGLPGSKSDVTNDDAPTITQAQTKGNVIFDPLAGKGTGRKSPGLGLPRDGGRRQHQGIDLFVPIGTPVYAIAKGKIIYSERRPTGGFGIAVKIDHGGGWTSAYAHLSKLAGFKKGQPVKKGQLIGYTGDTGNAKGMTGRDAHLHFEIRKNDVPQEPSQYLTGQKTIPGAEDDTAARVDAKQPPRDKPDATPENKPGWIQRGVDAARDFFGISANDTTPPTAQNAVYTANSGQPMLQQASLVTTNQLPGTNERGESTVYRDEQGVYRDTTGKLGPKPGQDPLDFSDVAQNREPLQTNTTPYAGMIVPAAAVAIRPNVTPSQPVTPPVKPRNPVVKPDKMPNVAANDNEIGKIVSWLERQWNKLKNAANFKRDFTKVLRDARDWFVKLGNARVPGLGYLEKLARSGKIKLIIGAITAVISLVNADKIMDVIRSSFDKLISAMRNLIPPGLPGSNPDLEPEPEIQPQPKTQPRVKPEPEVTPNPAPNVRPEQGGKTPGKQEPPREEDRDRSRRGPVPNPELNEPPPPPPPPPTDETGKDNRPTPVPPIIPIPDNIRDRNKDRKSPNGSYIGNPPELQRIASGSRTGLTFKLNEVDPDATGVSTGSGKLGLGREATLEGIISRRLPAGDDSNIYPEPPEPVKIERSPALKVAASPATEKAAKKAVEQSANVAADMSLYDTNEKDAIQQSASSVSSRESIKLVAQNGRYFINNKEVDKEQYDAALADVQRKIGTELNKIEKEVAAAERVSSPETAPSSPPPPATPAPKDADKRVEIVQAAAKEKEAPKPQTGNPPAKTSPRGQGLPPASTNKPSDKQTHQAADQKSGDVPDPSMTDKIKEYQLYFLSQYAVENTF